jgi:hypothetical protein
MSEIMLPLPSIQFFSCPHIVTVALFQSPSVTEDVLAPANLNKQLIERGGGGIVRLEGHVFTYAQNLVFYFGVFASLADILS